MPVLEPWSVDGLAFGQASDAAFLGTQMACLCIAAYYTQRTHPVGAKPTPPPALRETLVPHILDLLSQHTKLRGNPAVPNSVNDAIADGRIGLQRVTFGQWLTE